MKFKFTFLILALSMTTQAREVFAGRYVEINNRYVYAQRSDCVTEYRTPLSRRETRGQCRITKPLQLRWTVKAYPNFRENPHRVQYWEGEVGRDVSTEFVSLRELVDTCRGRVISKGQARETSVSSETFEVRNPNLSDDVSESFMLAPMAKAEAASELQDALQRCRQ